VYDCYCVMPSYHLPGKSPDCKYGVFKTLQECAKACDDGTCIDVPGVGIAEGQVAYDCYCQGPLPTITFPIPTKTHLAFPVPTKCESGEKLSLSACRDTCNGGSCGLHDSSGGPFGWICHCPGDVVV
jgi:hypothetical protein